ncbi:hypothetical protein [Bacillus pseudomycoides]|uniref:hypothetical protein n=1 Tax=Bacillus pseudomycoides TaxID=64104 RepID=UPI000501E82D|nr:hypothetical protein [Bacillus pseudomycoides]KFN10980.1 hypothetical protein DJ94_5433 [Bacillus pseudomycoides]MDR4188052.1 hypothetical protein [Bacillus pseudomycoides]MED0855669.1 hypothetical protein [Bacillus pseudomycoides]
MEKKFNQNQYMFAINKEVVERFQENCSKYSRSRAIRDVLVESHKNPKLNIRNERENITTHKLNLDDDSNNIVNDIVRFYSVKEGKAVNRSQVVEAILDKAADLDIPERKEVNKVFYVELDVLDEIRALTEGKILTHELEDYISDHYTKINSTIDSLKIKTVDPNSTQYRVNLDTKVLEKLQGIQKETAREMSALKIKGISLQVVFRDVLRQFLSYLKKHDSSQKQLQNEIAARKKLLSKLQK